MSFWLSIIFEYIMHRLLNETRGNNIRDSVYNNKYDCAIVPHNLLGIGRLRVRILQVNKI